MIVAIILGTLFFVILPLIITIVSGVVIGWTTNKKIMSIIQAVILISVISWEVQSYTPPTPLTEKQKISLAREKAKIAKIANERRIAEEKKAKAHRHEEAIKQMKIERNIRKWTGNIATVIVLISIIVVSFIILASVENATNDYIKTRERRNEAKIDERVKEYLEKNGYK